MQINSNEALNKIFEEAENIIVGLIDGKTFGSEDKFNENFIESLYSLGYIQYQQGKYEDAARTFGNIIFNDPVNIRAMRGLASSLQMQGKFEHAISFLSFAAVATDDNAEISLQVVECLLQLGRKRDAIRLLSKIDNAIKLDFKDDYVTRKIEGLKVFLDSNKDSKF